MVQWTELSGRQRPRNARIGVGDLGRLSYSTLRRAVIRSGGWRQKAMVNAGNLPEARSGAATVSTMSARCKLKRTPVILNIPRKPEVAHFKVLQWNVLADGLAQNGDFCRVPPGCLEWEYRRPLLLQEIMEANADIICLQELNHFDELQQVLSGLGYEGAFREKYASPALKYEYPPDGMAVFYRRSRFRCCSGGVEGRSFQDDATGREQSQGFLQILLTDLVVGRELLVVTTHLKAKDGAECEELRYQQAGQLLRNVAATLQRLQQQHQHRHGDQQLRQQPASNSSSTSGPVESAGPMDSRGDSDGGREMAPSVAAAGPASNGCNGNGNGNGGRGGGLGGVANGRDGRQAEAFSGASSSVACGQHRRSNKAGAAADKCCSGYSGHGSGNGNGGGGGAGVSYGGGVEGGDGVGCVADDGGGWLSRVPVVVTGDFNTKPGSKTCEAFQTHPLGLLSLWEQRPLDATLSSSDLDLQPPQLPSQPFPLLAAGGNLGASGTAAPALPWRPEFSTWKFRVKGESKRISDYIWFSGGGMLRPLQRWRMLTEEEIGPAALPCVSYASDHVSLCCEFEWDVDSDLDWVPSDRELDWG